LKQRRATFQQNALAREFLSHCRKELPEIEELNAEYKSKGLMVIGLNDEGRGTAKSYMKDVGLSFTTLDDSGRKAHRLYRVHSIPMGFLIDSEGTVVRFLRGGQDAKVLRETLKKVGL
jgi:peroxiredoxin